MIATGAGRSAERLRRILAPYSYPDRLAGADDRPAGHAGVGRRTERLPRILAPYSYADRLAATP
ncbi:hypothetical protein OHT76_18780 [Streptomyces sp. NBC_00287]|uniref:hypothetical protein n=1 Tax=Streptomyces sp. NBC_00287 TaxID=2975702 RepID=UPI002E2E1C86|nr:hypothetical protein [Streptomyces sp. NBC_00287]